VTLLRMIFGKRLKALRLERQTTQDELAQRTGLSTSFISSLERGINAPSFESLETLAQALGVRVRDFFDLAD
jgi:transcriptional regulator with XRE-family HTH domain